VNKHRTDQSNGSINIAPDGADNESSSSPTSPTPTSSSPSRFKEPDAILVPSDCIGLDLHATYVRATIATKLAAALAGNTVLLHLSLSDNAIGKSGVSNALTLTHIT
jgi:hypothetical protein